MGLHVIIHMGGFHQKHSLKGIQSVNSILCLMKDAFPWSRSLPANRCSHIVSSSLACFCSSSGQSSRPWRFNSSRFKSFPRFLSGGLPVAHGCWSNFSNDTFGQDQNGVSTQVPQADWYLEDPRCNSPFVTAHTMEAGSWGPTWKCMQCPQTSVWLWIFTVPKREMMTP